ncbi:6162_t:CDS:2, partial [Cetraspora pellucida]
MGKFLLEAAKEEQKQLSKQKEMAEKLLKALEEENQNRQEQ